MSEDVEISMGITVNPRRMGGTPCVKGTRIPAEMVAAFMDGDRPMRPDAILENYPSLTYNDLSNVKAWVARGSGEGTAK